MRLLLVEDEVLLGDAVVEALQMESYSTDWAKDGASARELVASNDYDLVVLDWTIPPPSGMQLLTAWRAAGMQIPVLMLTGRNSIEDRVDGLDCGADDYLTKPFSLVELMARIRSLLRRGDQTASAAPVADDLEMDRARHEVTVAGQSVDLSPKEFAVLEYLLTRMDEAVTRAEIGENAWEGEFDSTSRAVDIAVHRLRKKIDGARNDRLLHTVKGVGYMLRGKRRE